MHINKHSLIQLFGIASGFIGILLFGLSFRPASLSAASSTAQTTDDYAGWWSAELTCPGGKIRFEINLFQKEGKLAGNVVNGDEKIEIEDVSIVSNNLVIRFPHYDSVIRAELKNGQLAGDWKKFVGKANPDSQEFKASRGRRKYLIESGQLIDGKYQVKFESSDDPAVGVFKKNDKFVSGTFLTTTGDYRFLAGSFNKSTQELELSCFDGGHAFLFRARTVKGKLSGDFWSRNSWHEKWTGTRNPNASLADGFEQVKWAGVATSEIEFPDEHGKSWNLADKKFSGKVKIIQVFGSWCPNCHDATKFISELQKEYGSKGLSVVGLAFELSKDPKRNAEQIERYRKRTGASYPILIAGIADKSTATKQLRILSRVKSYPTTVFLDSKDRPIAIHSGFAGPATGEAYEDLKRRFRKIIERQLVEQ